MRTFCLHEPKRWVALSQKHLDGTPVMTCADCRSAWRRQNRRKKIGYDQWFEQQGGLCAFCGLALEEDSNKTHLDHNHVTGVKRGLVHAQCNLMIGGIENAVALVGLDHLLRYIAT